MDRDCSLRRVVLLYAHPYQDFQRTQNILVL